MSHDFGLGLGTMNRELERSHSDSAKSNGNQPDPEKLSSSSSSSDFDKKLSKDAEAQKRNKQTYENRLINARKWVMVVLSYYYVRAALVVLPLFKDETLFQQVVEIIQLFLSFCIVAGLVLSFKGHLELVKLLLLVLALDLAVVQVLL